MACLMLILLLLATVNTGQCQTVADAKSVYTKIFTTDSYNKEIRPAATQNTAVAVTVGLSIVAINDFDEKAGILNILAIFSVSWMDPSLVWTEGSYNGVSQLTLSEDKIWKPILFNLKEARKMVPLTDANDRFRVEVFSDGQVVWTPGSVLDVKCSPDVSKFPFDRQTCQVEVTAWGYTSSQVTLASESSTISTKYYEKNGVWDLIGTSVSPTVVNQISILSFELQIERLAAYYVINIIMPMVLLALLNPLVFLLPCECGERIGFGITILLSFTVFTTIVNSALPVSSNPLSIFSGLVFLMLIISTLISVANVQQIVFYHKEDSKPVPQLILAVVRLCACRGKIRVKTDAVEEVNEQNENPITGTHTWKDVVNELDKFYLKVSYVVIFCSFIIMLVVISVVK